MLFADSIQELNKANKASFESD